MATDDDKDWAAQWRERYDREQRDRFSSHTAREGRNWGPHGDWAFSVERDVRDALSKADPDIARTLVKDPAAVRSSYSDLGRKQAWTEPDWHAVLVGTESGIGDPYEYDHVHQAFDSAVKALNAGHAYKGQFRWGWDSINAGVHVFRMTPVDEVVDDPTINPCGCRKNPSPEETAAAVDKYKEFHRYDPHRIVEIDLAIPRRVRELGPAKHVLYRSGKVDPETLKKPKRPVDYIHEHDAGVTAYACDGAADTDVPEEFTKVGAVVVLGKCLGFALKDGTEAEGTHPLPDLCCTPDGRCLLVVQGKKKVLAMMWGGELGVFARGIDG